MMILTIPTVEVDVANTICDGCDRPLPIGTVATTRPLCVVDGTPIAVIVCLSCSKAA